MIESPAPCPALRRNETGFSLLELLLVLLILSTLAWMGLAAVGSDGDQVRYDNTRRRWQALRRAIVGDPDRSLDAQPLLRGYVADMGKLPEYRDGAGTVTTRLQALLAQNYCLGRADLVKEADCKTEGSGGTWVTQPAYTIDKDTGLGFGWRGPYLDPAEHSPYPRFLDGWGRDETTSNNFGWKASLKEDTASGRNNLALQSLGRDGKEEGDGFDADYPALSDPAQPAERLVNVSDYMVLVTDSREAIQGDAAGGLSVDLGAPPPCWRCSESPAGTDTWALCVARPNGKWQPQPAAGDSSACTAAQGVWQPTQKLRLRLAYRAPRATGPGDPEIVQRASSNTVSVTFDGSPQSALFIFEDPEGPTFEKDFYLPLGQTGYRLFGAADVPADDKAFPEVTAPWQSFTVLPGAALARLRWPLR